MPRELKPIPHGTPQGYAMELRRKPRVICADCREASRAYRSALHSEPGRAVERARQSRARSAARNRLARLYAEDFQMLYRQAYREELSRP